MAYLKDPKGRRQHLFGLFSPSRNIHLQAKSDADARAWVELIKHEARIDEEEREINLGSPTFYEANTEQPGHDRYEHERLGSSSPEPLDVPHLHSTTRDGIRIPSIQRPPVRELEYSGDELGPYSDLSDTHFSDTPPQSYTLPKLGPFISRKQRAASKSNTPYSAPLQRPGTVRNGSQASGFHADRDEEREIWHGYLLCLKTKGGVRQWKRLWVVLRPKNLAFYKNDEVRLYLLFWSILLMRYAGICCQSHHPSTEHHRRR